MFQKIAYKVKSKFNKHSLLASAVLVPLLFILSGFLPLFIIKAATFIYNLRVNQSAQINCEGSYLQPQWLDWNTRIRKGSKLLLTCKSEVVAPTSTPTSTAAPTPTPTPTPTQEPMMTPMPTGMGSTVTVHGHSLADLPVPLCTDHNPTKWHPLVQRNQDISVKCTYGHEHHDDPRILDSVFGPLTTYTDGQEIAYPWQTSSSLGMENHAKHEFYKWNAVTFGQIGNVCRPSNAELGFQNLRAEYHMDAVHGALIRFHSYWLEAQGCDPKDPNFKGIIRIGGHMDYGRLQLTDGGGGDGPVIPLAEDPVGYSDDRRLHMGVVDGTVPCCRNGDFTWYGSNRYVSTISGPKALVRNGLRGDDWGGLNPKDLKPVYSYTYWYGDRGSGGTNSGQEPFHLLAVTIPSGLDGKDGKTDGRVTFKGFTNRYGDILSSPCTTLGPDCVPLFIEGMKVGHYEFRATANLISDRQYDVLVNGKSTIMYPN